MVTMRGRSCLSAEVEDNHNAKGRFVGERRYSGFTGPLEFGERFKRIQPG